jgi:hypothetical protein
VIRKILAGCAALWACVAFGADGPSVLQVHVIEGQGSVYPAGSRATRGITVLVTDEAGRPVSGALVSFTLPADGPGGVFASGGRTEIATTRDDGRAAVWGMRWNRSAGQFEVRISATKGQARGSASVDQALINAPAPKLDSGASGVHLGGHKLLWISVAIVGAAAVGVAGLGGTKNAASQSSPGGTPGSVQSGSLSIGSPTISLGHP